MGVEFKVHGNGRHVEVWHGGSLIATIVPGAPDLGCALTIKSKFIDGHVRDERATPLPAEITVLFDLEGAA